MPEPEEQVSRAYRVINLNWKILLSFCEQTMVFSSKNESSSFTVYADILLYGWYRFFKPIFYISNSLYMKYLFCKKSVFFYRKSWPHFVFLDVTSKQSKWLKGGKSTYICFLFETNASSLAQFVSKLHPKTQKGVNPSSRKKQISHKIGIWFIVNLKYEKLV